MGTSQEIARVIETVLNSQAGQELIKPMFDEAYSEGRINNESDLQAFKAEFVLALISNTPELLSMLAGSVWKQVRNIR